MARPQRWELLLRASQQEALLAVSLFNDPGRERALEGFVVHMHIAWMYAFHSEWLRAGRTIMCRSASRRAAGSSARSRCVRVGTDLFPAV
ncbi:DUF3644 domain-containing protein [Mycobacterium spongiae]|uniref:DUF3644 domain-containing protein n=1 Tax=Mycobacterium spongiae TaxID=886343 RepID=UPI003CCEC2EB